MKHIIEFNRDELRIDKKIMKFGYDIRDIKVVDNQVIVLLSIPFHTNEIDNIYAVSLDCKINWRVESLNIISPDGDNLPYENLFFHNGELTATDFYGRRYFINLTNASLPLSSVLYTPAHSSTCTNTLPISNLIISSILSLVIL